MKSSRRMSKLRSYQKLTQLNSSSFVVEPRIQSLISLGSPLILGQLFHQFLYHRTIKWNCCNSHAITNGSFSWIVLTTSFLCMSSANLGWKSWAWGLKMIAFLTSKRLRCPRRKSAISLCSDMISLPLRVTCSNICFQSALIHLIITRVILHRLRLTIMVAWDSHMLKTFHISKKSNKLRDNPLMNLPQNTRLCNAVLLALSLFQKTTITCVSKTFRKFLNFLVTPKLKWLKSSMQKRMCWIAKSTTFVWCKLASLKNILTILCMRI